MVEFKLAGLIEAEEKKQILFISKLVILSNHIQEMSK